jgi:selenocysteine lyase/cysteine desulfurase
LCLSLRWATLSTVFRSAFASTGVYLDSATYGLPPAAALDEFASVLAGWAAGSYDPLSCDEAVARARRAFARLYGVQAADVAIGHQVSPLVGLVAGSLPQGARVLAPDGDFTSLLFPFLAADAALQTVPLDQVAEAIDARTDLVAVSAVQSADGRLADVDAIASGGPPRRAHPDRRHTGLWLAPARRRPVRRDGRRRVQVALPPARDGVHDRRPPRA